jgi:hypothetical protein
MSKMRPSSISVLCSDLQKIRMLSRDDKGFSVRRRLFNTLWRPPKFYRFFLHECVPATRSLVQIKIRYLSQYCHDN